MDEKQLNYHPSGENLENKLLRFLTRVWTSLRESGNKSSLGLRFENISGQLLVIQVCRHHSRAIPDHQPDMVSQSL
ncbi:hypothetical protein EVAR_80057_1 [Eumeta japonica]|uniref:Uncharacterized protein n=1 Tax=Eumeta variegata TaxID=151549 RepID=A0A4C1WN80_EUMVA|nr:hypothetical protein EVAR_80057_1 [Eumeta japonica]